MARLRLNLSESDVDTIIEALRHAVKTGNDEDSFAGTLSRVELEAQGSRMVGSDEENSGGPILTWKGSQQAQADFMELQNRAGRH